MFLPSLRGGDERRRELDGARWEEDLKRMEGETAAIIKRGVNRLR